MQLRLESFDGPLDLLLHLIRAHEINIFNIPMLLIAKQYLIFIRNSATIDYHVIGEYLAMAAQLIEIKATLLVPALQNKIVDSKNFDEIPEDDPRRPLVASLLEFEAIKQACIELDSLKILGRDVFSSGHSLRCEEEFSEILSPIKGDPFSLVIAFERVLLRFAENQALPTVKVRAQKITIQTKMSQIKSKLTQNIINSAPLTVRDLFEDCETRYELIVTIMAVLELCKSNHLCVDQVEFFAPIYLKAGRHFFQMAPEIEEKTDEVLRPTQ